MTVAPYIHFAHSCTVYVGLRRSGSPQNITQDVVRARLSIAGHSCAMYSKLANQQAKRESDVLASSYIPDLSSSTHARKEGEPSIQNGHSFHPIPCGLCDHMYRANKHDSHIIRIKSGKVQMSIATCDGIQAFSLSVRCLKIILCRCSYHVSPAAACWRSGATVNGGNGKLEWETES